MNAADEALKKSNREERMAKLWFDGEITEEAAKSSSELSNEMIDQHYNNLKASEK